MRALITGITGFTGRYVAAELERAGFDVHGLGANSLHGDDRYHQVNLMDIEGLRRCVDSVRPDVVVHLAAIAFVGHGDPEAFYRINLLGTRNLLLALSTSGRLPESVLLASSANVYGNIAEGILDELTPPSPANDYAVSKLSMEYMARLWFDRLPITIVRPFNYTGVGQSDSFLLPKIVKHFRTRSDSIELGNLDVWRDFSDVRAVANAYRRLLEVKPSGKVINVCSGHTHSLRGVLEIAEAITGHSIEVRVNPHFVRANEVRSLSGDPSLLKSFIGEWNSPPLEETLRWMLETA